MHGFAVTDHAFTYSAFQLALGTGDAVSQTRAWLRLSLAFLLLAFSNERWSHVWRGTGPHIF